MNFTKEERLLMLLYSPGTRSGLISELSAMRLQLTPSERRLNRLTGSVLEKLNGMTDAEFDGLELYPDV